MIRTPFLLHHLANRSAKRFPDKPAVVFAEESISYGELDRRSNQVANALIAAGCKRGDRVGIHMQKSARFPIAVLGVLKAGAAYVPVDPKAPVRRAGFIMRDCGVSCVIASARKLEALSDLEDGDLPVETAICLDRAPTGGSPVPHTVSPEELSALSDTDPEVPTIETDLAYILYTSGSTGNPKGVMITHLNALTFVRWACETVGLAPDDRVSNHAPLHFDLSIFDLFATFMAGGTLLPVPDSVAIFPSALADWIEKQAISVWYSVPSVLSLIAVQGGLSEHRFPDLRTVLFAGEVFPAKYLRAWLESVPNVGFYNLYGPTETNVITYYEVAPQDADRTDPVPIGKACANMDVFALTAQGDVVTEEGEEGELYARGSFVAQGYWGDPERSEKVFLANLERPWLRDMTYRTGDLVRLDAEGNYHFLGRRDHMVKRRGYRIELGEIESTLSNHDAVVEAVVVAEPDDELGNRLIAFVVSGDARLSTAELQNHLSEWLPRYMVPDLVTLRDALPKTSTGKVDRRALVASLEEPATPERAMP